MGSPVIFLPGIIMPAADRYAALIDELGGHLKTITKDLEVYRLSRPPAGYSIETEIAGISSTADVRRLDRFHLYGHSAGGAIAIAFAVANPDRVLSLAIDEPAMDFTPEDHADPLWTELDRIAELPAPGRMAAFQRHQLSPGIEPPPPPPGPPPEWMAKRPAGIVAFLEAGKQHVIPEQRLREFDRPVYYSRGTLSDPYWERSARRLERLFPDVTSEIYAGLHHLHTSHIAEPARVAAALQSLWSRAESMSPS
ncbi:MAG TPA: alpha/beta hydrolase [Candidatus Dormibacteraeota bacterium]